MSVSTHFFSYFADGVLGGGGPVGDFLTDDYTSDVLVDDYTGEELENA